jgi:hypothetical protein
MKENNVASDKNSINTACDAPFKDSNSIEQDYTPYGEEWEKEMSKFPKVKLVKMFGGVHMERNQWKDIAETNASELKKVYDSVEFWKTIVAQRNTSIDKLIKALNDIKDEADKLPKEANLFGAVDRIKEKTSMFFNDDPMNHPSRPMIISQAFYDEYYKMAKANKFLNEHSPYAIAAISRNAESIILKHIVEPLQGKIMVLTELLNSDKNPERSVATEAK